MLLNVETALAQKLRILPQGRRDLGGFGGNGDGIGDPVFVEGSIGRLQPLPAPSQTEPSHESIGLGEAGTDDLAVDGVGLELQFIADLFGQLDAFGKFAFIEKLARLLQPAVLSVELRLELFPVRGIGIGIEIRGHGFDLIESAAPGDRLIRSLFDFGLSRGKTRTPQKHRGCRQTERHCC